MDCERLGGQHPVRLRFDVVIAQRLFLTIRWMTLPQYWYRSAEMVEESW